MLALKDDGQMEPDSTKADLRKEILGWYDGYSLRGTDRILNP